MERVIRVKQDLAKPSTLAENSSLRSLLEISAITSHLGDHFSARSAFTR